MRLKAIRRRRRFKLPLRRRRSRTAGGHDQQKACSPPLNHLNAGDLHQPVNKCIHGPQHPCLTSNEQNDAVFAPFSGNNKHDENSDNIVKRCYAERKNRLDGAWSYEKWLPLKDSYIFQTTSRVHKAVLFSMPPLHPSPGCHHVFIVWNRSPIERYISVLRYSSMLLYCTRQLQRFQNSVTKRAEKCRKLSSLWLCSKEGGQTSHDSVYSCRSPSPGASFVVVTVEQPHNHSASVLCIRRIAKPQINAQTRTFHTCKPAHLWWRNANNAYCLTNWNPYSWQIFCNVRYTRNVPVLILCEFINYECAFGFVLLLTCRLAEAFWI